MLKPETIEALRSAKLHISDEPFFPENHVAWPSGYIIFKPASVKGNGHEYSESWYKDEKGIEVKTLSTGIRVWNESGKTHIQVSEYAPGPGPGDFLESFDNEQEAVNRVIKYYFDQEDPEYKLWHEAREKSRKWFEKKDS